MATTQQGYRFLKDGEVIEAGDETYDYSTNTWKPTNPKRYGDKHIFWKYSRRRPLSPAPAQPAVAATPTPPAAMYRPLQSGEIIQGTDEYQTILGWWRAFATAPGMNHWIGKTFDTLTWVGVPVRRPLLQQSVTPGPPNSAPAASLPPMGAAKPMQPVTVKVDPYAAHRQKLAAKGIHVDGILRNQEPDERLWIEVQHEDYV